MDILLALQSPGAEIFQIGPIAIRWYGLLIAISIFIGLNLSTFLSRKRGLKKNIINDLLPIIVLFSLIGARSYYVIFEWGNYTGMNFWSYINLAGLKISIPSAIEIWGGGIAIHGALIGGVISVLFFSNWKKESFWDLLDVLVPSVALGQAIGRWGNFFNNEAFGTPTELPWKIFIPFKFRPEVFINERFFHPTFLYESIWNVSIFILLILLFERGYKNKIRLYSGSLSCIYIITYSIGRVWIEGLRIDPLCVASTLPFCEGGFRVAQLISILFTLIGSYGLWQIYKRKRSLPSPFPIINK